MINDFAIKAHNQGLTKTLKRDVHGKEPVNPKVESYLQKVKSGIADIQKQRQQDMDARKAALTPTENLGPTPSTPIPAADLVPQMKEQVIPDKQQIASQPELSSQLQMEDGGLVPDYSQYDDIQSPLRPKEDMDYTDAKETAAQGVALADEEKADSIAPKADVSREVEGVEGLTPTEELAKDDGVDKETLSNLREVRNSPNIDVQAEYNKLMGAYKDAKDSRDEARSTRSKLEMIDAMSKFSSQFAAGKAQEAGGFEVKGHKGGIKVPTVEELDKGEPLNVLRDRMALLKQYESSRGNKKSSDYKERTLALAEKRYKLGEDRLRVMEDRELGKQGRFDRSQDFREKEKQEISDKQTETISEFDTGQALVDEVKKLIKSNKDNLGPWASQAEEGKKYVPGMSRDSDFVAMQSLVGTQLADYVKRMSGAAVSEEEAQRLAKNIPTMTDKPESFQRKLKEFEKILKKNRKIVLSGFEKQGKDPSAFKKPKVKLSRKDEAAKKWAEANPNDPRSSKILEKLSLKGAY